MNEMLNLEELKRKYKIKTAISAVKLNAKELKTTEPEIFFLPASHFLSPTIEAALSEDGKSIAINQEIKQNMFFIVSHEMRHLWQMQNGGYITDDYMPSDGQNRTEQNTICKKRK